MPLHRPTLSRNLAAAAPPLSDRSPIRRVLVVVPTLDEAAHIEGVLTQLRRQAPAHVALRYVVCDGGSTDGTQAIVRRLAADGPELHLLHNPRRLQAAAINLAVARHGAECQALIRCDAHASYPEDFIGRLLESLVQHDADAVVVPMDSQGETCLQRAVAWVSDSIVGSGGSAHRGGRRSGFVDHGHHAAFRLDSFVRAGGYDESFTHNEDAEFDCRQRALGARIYLDADIRVTYAPRATLGALWRQYRAYGKGRSRTMRRHPQSWRARQLAVPTHVVLCGLAFASAPRWPLALAYPAAYLFALAASSLVLALRHRSWCGLLAGPAALVMHFAWGLGLIGGWLGTREPRWEPAPEAPPVATDRQRSA